jgi:hypothetical protein
MISARIETTGAAPKAREIPCLSAFRTDHCEEEVDGITFGAGRDP